MPADSTSFYVLMFALSGERGPKTACEFFSNISNTRLWLVAYARALLAFLPKSSDGNASGAASNEVHSGIETS
jgi:hypothetical protein